MPLRDQREFIDITVFGDTQKTYLVVDPNRGAHVPLGTTGGFNPVCIGCRCCSTRDRDPFYCHQCLRGVPRP